MLSELSILFNFTVLHSISLFCTGEIALIIDLGLIDMFSANQTTEIVACILLITLYYCFTSPNGNDNDDDDSITNNNCNNNSSNNK